jgi:hypothetical protein
VSQAKTSLPDDGLSDFSDDESTDDNPQKGWRKITRAYALEDVTAPVLSIHEAPRAAKSTRVEGSDELDDAGTSTQKRSKVSLNNTSIERNGIHPESEP